MKITIEKELMTKIKMYYIISFAAIQFLSNVPTLGNVHALLRLFLPIGLLLIAIDFMYFRTREFLKSPNIYLILFLIAYVITILVNGRMAIYESVKSFLWMCIQLLLICNTFSEINWEYGKKYWFSLSWVYITLTAIASTISLYYYFSQRYFIVQNNLFQGYYWDRLFGIYREPNFASCFALISIACSVFIIRELSHIKTFIKKWLIFNVLIQCMYFAGAGSRTGLVAISTTVFIYALYNAARFSVRKGRKRAFRAVLISILCVLMVYPSYFVLRTGMSCAAEVVNEVNVVITNYIRGDSVALDTIMAPRVNRTPYSDDISSGRLVCWYAGINIWLKYPLIGVGDRNIQYFSELLPNIPALPSSATHNSVIKVLASSGILGFVSLAVFASVILRKCVRLLMLKDFSEEKRGCLEFFVLLAGMIFAASLFIEDLFFINSFQSIIFWISIGMILNINQHIKKEGI